MPKSISLFITTLLWPVFSFSQVHTVPFTGSDTSRACVGILRDHGGTGFYSNHANGFFVIDPPGNENISLIFSQFNTQYFYDYVIIYDGVGTSAPLLASYSGPSLPNSGNPVTSTSGAITVRFTSSSANTFSGFELSWVAAAGPAPNASFSVSHTSPQYNSPVQFINTTTGGSTYLWEFGDGTTSAETNPVHRYTNSGLHQVRLIASSCNGSDTTLYTNINVQAAPSGSVSADTLSMTVPCGTSNATSFSISNSGSGTLSYQLQLNQPSANLVVDEDFEDNTLGSFTNLTPSYYATAIQTTGAPEGARYLQFSGNGGTNDGLQSQFPDAVPEVIRYTTKADYSGSYNGYIQFGQRDLSAGFSPFFYSVYYYGTLRLYYRQNGFNQYYSHSITLGQWNTVEMKNINFTDQTYDLYLNGTLLFSSCEFLNPVSSLNEISIYNYNYGDIGLDDIEIYANDLLSHITYNPSAGNLNNGSSNTIFINADATDLLAGTYLLNFEMSSNDTSLDGKIIPFRLHVTGAANLNQDKSCINYGNIYTGFNSRDSVLVWNTGCDTLLLNSFSTTHTDISVSNTTVELLPDDSTYLYITLNPSSPGAYNDTVFASGPDTSTAVCITAQAAGAPVISTDSATYHIYYTGCSDSVSFPLIVQNTGQGTLNWSARSTLLTNLTDNFESPTLSASLWSSWNSGVSTGNLCGAISGTRSLIFNGSGSRYITTVPINSTGGGTISFTMNQSSCELADNGEGIYLMYSADNGSTWNTINYYYTSTLVNYYVSEPVPAAAQGTHVLFRLLQSQSSGYDYDMWTIDDFSISSGISNQLVFTPDTGALAINSSVTLTGKIGISGFTTGVYNFTGHLSSNDPNYPVYTFSAVLHLTGVPNIESPVSCLDMDTVLTGTTRLDSVLIYNNGCGDLNLSSLSTTQGEFTVLSTPSGLAPGDSMYIYVELSPANPAGSVRDTLVIASNDTTKNICLTAYTQGAPVVSIDTSLISVSLNGCNDSIAIQRVLYNNGLSPLSYKLLESRSLSLQEVLDTFRNSFATVTAQNPFPYNFSEGFTGSNIGDGGGDMYDGGNMITTNLSSTYLSYSHDAVIPSALLGNNGSYFTYKANGIWLFAADLNGVTDFNIDGDLGADGSGVISAAILNSSVNGVSYTGFVKRVYNAGDPSVNHLVIIENNPAVSHTYSSYTGSDNHSISGLSNTTRLYYLLYAGSGGNFIDNAATQNIMDTFLNLLYKNASGKIARVTPDSGQVPVADSTVLNIWIRASGLTAGIHTSQVLIQTNDPLKPELLIPVQITLTGSAEMAVTPACMDFDSLFVGLNTMDSTLIRNTGCDTLHLTAYSSISGHFSLQNLPLTVAPGDSVMAQIEYQAGTIGLVQDTLFLYGNSDTAGICVTGKGLGAPQVSVPQDTLQLTLNKCKGFVIHNFSLHNSGQGTLHYNMMLSEPYRDTSRATYSGSGATTTHNFSNLPSAADTVFFTVVVNGDFDGSTETYSVTVDGTYLGNYFDHNFSNGTMDTAVFYYTGPDITNWLSDGQLAVNITNTSGVNPGYIDLHFVEVKVKSTAPSWVSILSVSAGALSSGQTTNKDFLFNANSLDTGIYTTTLLIQSDDPVNPSYVVPVIFNVVEEPEIKVSATCIDYGTVTGPSTDSIYIKNEGCADLIISGIQFGASGFSSKHTTLIIPPGDSIWLPISFTPAVAGSVDTYFLINNNDSTVRICLNAVVQLAPVAAYNYTVVDACNGTVVFTDNSQRSPASWFWDFGDGSTSTQRSPVHSYAKPGIYNTSLVVSNTAGSDSITEVLYMTDVLYVDFSMPDTIYTNQPVQFYDSSQVGTSWQWFFGDGGSSVLQNPVHTYSNPGTYLLSYIVTSASCTKTVNRNVVVQAPVGLNDIELFELKIFPVPASDKIVVDWEKEGLISTLIISDITGKTVWSEQVSGSSCEVQVSQYSEGVYFLRLINNRGITDPKKFIIKRK